MHEGIQNAVHEKLVKIKIIPILDEKSSFPPLRSPRSTPLDASKVRKSHTLKSVLEKSNDITGSQVDSSAPLVTEEIESSITTSKTISSRFPRMYFVGQFHNTYLLIT